MKTIRELRMERDWSQMVLAMKLGLSLAAVSKWEAGKSNPSAHQLKRLADLLGVSMDSIELPRPNATHGALQRVVDVVPA